MKYNVTTVKDYLNAMPLDRAIQINQIREVIKTSLPKGFEEIFLYDMITYVVPLDTYPKGYHVKKDTPLPFIAIASQKHTINLYHFGIYAHQGLHDDFIKSYENSFQKKPDMGKSCIRFKKIDDQLLDVIKNLMTKMSVAEFISIYEKNLKV